MTYTVLVGLLVVFVAGVFNGSFATPMKVMTKWEWENQWVMWAFWALLVCSWALALASVPDLFGVYRDVGTGIIFRTFLLGVGAGLGMVTFGLGIHLVGLSLGFSIILGITAVTGSLVPMLLLSPGDLFSRAGAFILSGLVVTITGVAFCGAAGKIREQSTLQSLPETPSRHPRFVVGLLVCIASGILNAMINLSFISGVPIAEAAMSHIEGPIAAFRANNAIWSVAFTGAFIPNGLYCGWLLVQRNSWKRFSELGTRHYWSWTLLMGVVWMTGYALYGAGASMLGRFGGTVGWIALFAVTVMSGNVCGLITGEWKNAPTKARIRMIQGILLLLASIVLVAFGGG